MRDGTTPRILLSDHLGSTALTVELTSVFQTSELRYLPWGETWYACGSTPTTFRFTGQRDDDTIGLYYYYGARFYDSALGRFIQADTILPSPGDPQSLNRYSHVFNNPLRYSDCHPEYRGLAYGQT